MPLYEFACKKCDHTFEELVLAREAVQCPHCQTEDVERLLSRPARPRTAAPAMPMACNPEGPSCGAPWCKKPR